MTKESKLLKKQIEKLRASDFDLDAWKDSTASILSRIFGSSDLKVKQIQSLKIDYGSWALRDAKASYNPLESCKKRGEEILETAISEMEAFGAPEQGKDAAVQILGLLGQQLSATHFENLKEILESGEDRESRKKILVTKLKTLEQAKLAAIIADIILTSDPKQ